MKLETKNFYKTVGALVLPIALQNLINVAVTSADVVMLGRVGETVLSGSSLAGQVQFILTLFIFGLTSGAAVLTATGKDGKSSTISHIVTRVPDLDTYTRAAWKMDYERLHAAPNSQKGQIYLCEGTVKDLQTATKGVTFSLDLGNDQLLKMTYTGVHVPTEGKEYRIYADVLGQQDGLPLLGARFIYSK